jgi:hypothetical protein
MESVRKWLSCGSEQDMDLILNITATDLQYALVWGYLIGDGPVFQVTTCSAIVKMHDSHSQVTKEMQARLRQRRNKLYIYSST